MGVLRAVPVALTIAGSDSGGGAGIQADLKTFAALGVYGVSAITAVTAQNTVGVRSYDALSPELVGAQIDAVIEDLGCDAAKSGMLATAQIVSVVAQRVVAHGITRLVVDPVMVSKSGRELLDENARVVLVRELLPLALVLTPNLDEAEALLGRPVRSLDEMRVAARALSDLGPKAVVVKGGHLAGPPADVLYVRERDEEHILEGGRLLSRNTHGTGCTFAAAIAAELAKGSELAEAVRTAKRFTALAIEHSLALGGGKGPVNQIAAGRRMERDL